MMFKNNYLQLYKSSSSQHINPNILITHFHHIYSTLGCVLQDLQYQIGRLVLQNTQFSQIIQKEEKYKQIDLNKNERGSKGREIRQLKQIDRRSGKSQQRQQFSRRNKEKQQKQIKHKFLIQKQKVKVQNTIHQKGAQSPDFLNFLMYQDKIKQKPVSYYPQQKLKNYFNKNPYDKYEQTFNIDKLQKRQLIPQKIQLENSNPQNSTSKLSGESFDDDFMDKIFKDAQSRKSK